jgi:type II secretion system protein L
MKLRVFLPAAERPDAATRFAWKLFGARHELLRDETTVLADMPRAGEVEAVIPAERVLCARLKLPRVNAATIRELLPYAVEDRLLADPAHIHAVAGARNARGESIVAVVDRNWLQAMVDALALSGHRPGRAFSESALLAGGRGDWHVVWGHTRGILVDDDGVAATFDRAPGLPLAVRLAIDEAAARGDRPNLVRVHHAGGEPLPDIAAWARETGVAFAAGTTWEALAAGEPPADAINLLQGEFSPDTARRARPAARGRVRQRQARDTMNRIVHAWQTRSPRERRNLRAAAVLLGLALVVAFVWLPLERSRARLAAELPRLRASIDGLQRDAGEVKRLRASAPAAATPSAPLASLATNGGGLPGAQFAVLDERRVRVSGADVGFGALLEWLRNAQVTHGMRVESARLEALPAPGRVRAELVLARS